MGGAGGPGGSQGSGPGGHHPKRGRAWTWPGSRAATPAQCSQSRGGRGRASGSPVGSERAHWGEKRAPIPARQSPPLAAHAHPCLSFPSWSHPAPLMREARALPVPSCWAQPPRHALSHLGIGKEGPTPHMGTFSHPRALLAQGGTHPRFTGHSAAVAGALREVLCTSPTKITAVPTPHWQRSSLSGMHIPAPRHRLT